MTLVTLGMRPSLHAAARQHEGLAVSLAALYDKVKRSEPAVLRGLISGSAQRLMPVVAQWGGPASLAGWQLRIVDGNHLAASDKRLKVLRGHRGVALPGHSLVVYDPDAGLVCDMVACEDAHESERVGVLPLIGRAQCGQLWIADRHFCTHTILDSLARTGAHPGSPSKETGASPSAPTRARCASKPLLSRASTSRPPEVARKRRNRLRPRDQLRSQQVHGGASRSPWTVPPKPVNTPLACGRICP